MYDNKMLFKKKKELNGSFYQNCTINGLHIIHKALKQLCTGQLMVNTISPALFKLLIILKILQYF